MTFALPQRTQELLRAFAARPTLSVEQILSGAGPAHTPPRPKASRTELIARLNEISDRCAALPVLDQRSPDEIIGYNEHGAFD